MRHNPTAARRPAVAAAAAAVAVVTSLLSGVPSDASTFQWKEFSMNYWNDPGSWLRTDGTTPAPPGAGDIANFTVQSTVYFGGDAAALVVNVRDRAWFEPEAGANPTLALTNGVLVADDGGLELGSNGAPMTLVAPVVRMVDAANLYVGGGSRLVANNVDVGPAYIYPTNTSLAVSGAGSSATITGALTVGAGEVGTVAQGNLSVSDGASASLARAVIGNADGAGTLSIESASHVTASGDISVGAATSGHAFTFSSRIDVVGGSSLTQTGTGSLTIGHDLPYDADNLVNVGGGSGLRVGSGGMKITRNGSLAVGGAGSSVMVDGDVNVAGGSVSVGSGGRVEAASVHLAADAFFGVTASTLTVGGPGVPGTLEDGATVFLSDHSTLTLYGGLSVTGTIWLDNTSRMSWTPAAALPDAVSSLRALLAGARVAATSSPAEAIGYVVVSPGTLLVRPVIPGDANLDGSVDPDDYALLDRGFATGGESWWEGDFNYDGRVDQDDYLVLDTLYGQAHGFSAGLLAQRESRFGPAHVSQLLVSIPEPSTMACVLAAFALLRRRRSKSD
jgi:hypothetical protein